MTTEIRIANQVLFLIFTLDSNIRPTKNSMKGNNPDPMASILCEGTNSLKLRNTKSIYLSIKTILSKPWMAIIKPAINCGVNLNALNLFIYLICSKGVQKYSQTQTCQPYIDENQDSTDWFSTECIRS